MRNLVLNKLCRISLLLFGGLFLTSCSDNDFDLSNIDATLGFSGDSISLPGNNSTDKIKLDDVLDLDTTGCVKILKNGDYAFSKSGDQVAPAHPEVAKVNVSSSHSTEIPYYLFGSQTAKGSQRIRKAAGTVISSDFSGSILAFDYHYAGVPSEIEDLDVVTTDLKYTVTVSFSDEIKKNIPEFKTLGVSFPKFLTISSITRNGAQVTVADNRISLTNVSSGTNLVLVVNISGMSFKAESTTTDQLTFNKESNKIDVTGHINISGTFEIDATNVAAGLVNKQTCVINSSLQMSDFTITGATGKFSPAINLDNIGSVSLTSIPDFLSDKDVNLDLYNPQIDLTVTSDLPIAGLVNGVLTSKYNNGKADVSVTIPQFSVKPAATTRICICKHKTAVTGVYDQIVEVSNLSDLIKVIPKTISFRADAKADASATSTIELGKQYTVQPAYSMNAPLAFSDDANIVYRDTLDGWNDDVKKLQLSDGGYVLVTASAINKIPVYLTLSANAIDTNGKGIGQDEMEIVVSQTINASDDGNTERISPVTVKITPKNSSVFKKLDGIVIKAVGAASASGKSAVSEITINAYNQTLTLDKISVKIVGKVITDQN